MNNITKITLVSLIALSFAGIASADTSVFVSPTGVTKNLGSTFSTTVELSAQNDNVCVVMGDISFANLSCQSITLSSGIMGQASPTCQNPHFVVGIPTCTLTPKTLLNVSVAALSPGNATISLSNVRTINQSGQVASTSLNGSYTVQGVLSSSTTSTSTSPTSAASTTTTTTTTNGQNALVAPNQTTPEGSTTAEQVVSEVTNSKNFLADIKDAIFNKNTAWILAIILLLAAAYFIVKSFYKKSPPKQQ